MFKIGQKVVCISDEGWITGDTHEKSFGPKKGDVLEIVKISPPTILFGEKPEMVIFLCFKEYSTPEGTLNGFLSSCFRPLATQYESATAELVNVKQITETSDQPMRNPSPMAPMKELINN